MFHPLQTLSSLKPRENPSDFLGNYTSFGRPTQSNKDIVQVEGFSWSKCDMLPMLVLCRFLDGGSLDLQEDVTNEAKLKRRVADLKRQFSSEGKQGPELTEALVKALTTKC